jgi:hypothetical protein
VLGAGYYGSNVRVEGRFQQGLTNVADFGDSFAAEDHVPESHHLGDVRHPVRRMNQITRHYFIRAARLNRCWSALPSSVSPHPSRPSCVDTSSRRV